MRYDCNCLHPGILEARAEVEKAEAEVRLAKTDIGSLMSGVDGSQHAIAAVGDRGGNGIC
jgi:hypothetical protein